MAERNNLLIPIGALLVDRQLRPLAVQVALQPAIHGVAPAVAQELVPHSDRREAGGDCDGAVSGRRRRPTGL